MAQTFAILLTDVVDSTLTNSTLGDAVMVPLWQAHDRQARTLMQQWRGREIGRSDGFLVLFDAVADAVGFALHYHRAMADLPVPLQARVGIHFGDLTLRENSAEDRARGAPPAELDGVALPLAARVMAAALGRQTLLSDSAQAVLGATPQRVLSHGHWRFKGLLEPMHVFEVGGEGAPFAPPPDSAKAYCVVRSGEHWVPRRDVRNNLPAERDTFVGRGRDLRLVAERFESGARLVSVFGAGGTGKTRLALRFARSWLGDFPGGAWFCDMSMARSVDGIVHAIAQALDVPLGQADPLVQISAAIAGRGECLLIFDNFEQVAPHAEVTLGQWLERAPDARFLVTTREVLGIVGEQTLALDTLPMADAVALFEHRAAACEGYRPTPEDVRAIPQLVTLMDGLPLAIELAAPRVRVMPPRLLLARMAERFKLLVSTSGRRERQATLRATLDWSWELLNQPERDALAKLSVFQAGFTLDAAEAVLGSDISGGRPWAGDLVQMLVEKSLVRQLGAGRFDLLLSVQDYAAERLEQLSATARLGLAIGASMQTVARAAHWTYFANLDEAPAGACVAELENLMAATRHAALHGDVEASSRALVATWAALKMSGPFRAALPLLAAVKAMGAASDVASVRLGWVGGRAYHLLGDPMRARHDLDRGMEAVQRLDSLLWTARLLCASADLYTAAGASQRARDELDRAWTIAQSLSAPELSHDVLNTLGAWAMAQGRIGEAREWYERALAQPGAPATGHARGGLLGNLGELCMAQGELDHARRYFDDALALVSTGKHRRWEGNIHCNLGLLHHEQGRSHEAEVELQAALAIAAEIGYLRLEATVLCNLGIVLQSLGKLALAVASQHKAVALAQHLGDPRAEGQFLVYLCEALTLSGDVVQARHHGLRAEMLLRTAGDSLSLGLALCALCAACASLETEHQAAGYFAEARRIAVAAKVLTGSELGRALQRAQALLDVRAV